MFLTRQSNQQNIALGRVTASTKAKVNYIRASIPTAFVCAIGGFKTMRVQPTQQQKMIRGAELLHSLTQNLLGRAGCDSKQA